MGFSAQRFGVHLRSANKDGSLLLLCIFVVFVRIRLAAVLRCILITEGKVIDKIAV